MKSKTLTAVSVALFLSFVSIRAAADQARFLPRAEDSLEEFSRLILSAKKSVNIATFIFDPCSASTQVLMQELAAQAKKGVKVRMLLDAFQLDSSYKQNLINWAAVSGIYLSLYADSITDDINARMHIKFMTVDDGAVIAGGRNWSDEYFALSSRLNYADRDLSVVGASGLQAAAYFEELWAAEKTSTTSPDSNSYTKWNAACGASAHLAYRVAQVKSFLSGAAQTSWSQVPTRSCANVIFRSDNPDFRDLQYGLDPNDLNTTRLSHKRATKHILDFMAGTKGVIRLENYSYVPVGILEQGFANLRARNVSTDVISNADMEDGPDFFKEAQEYATYLIAGQDARGSEKIELVSSKGALSDAHALTPKGTLFYLHGKTATRDGQDVLVGSFNLDGRSMNINLESMLIVSGCPDLAADVAAEMDQTEAVYRSDKIQPRTSFSDFAKFFESIALSEF